MGVQKIFSKIAKKSSKVESMPDLEIDESKLSAKAWLGAAAMKAGPAHKKVHASGKTQAPKSPAKAKATAGQSHHTASKTAPVTHSKVQSKTKSAQSSPRKASSGSNGRSSLESMTETVCREVACEGLATSGGYCRLHYIKNWKKIKRKELILREKKLNQYIEELVAKYPDKYIEAIRQDLANDKDFAKVIYDLDLDEGVDDFDIEGSESADSLIDTIKRDFDDEGEVF
jgi:hypothetical protein